MSAVDLRVCIVAEHASTRLGGEAILPYHYFRVLRERGIDAHLFVHERTREELQQLFPADHDRLHFAADQWLQKLFFHAGKLLPRRVAEATFGLANQMLTQRAQRRMMRPLLRAGAVVHQPIPVSPRAPSLMYGLGCPVVCGPLNGGMTYPPAFRKSESILTRALVAMGRGFSGLANKMLPGKRRAAVVLAANERTQAALPASLTGRVLLLTENGVDLSRWNPVAVTPLTELAAPARYIFIGRLVDWKALDIVLEALALTEDAVLDVVGDGPMRAHWQQLANTLGLATRVTFHGWRTQSECVPMIAAARALVLPSLFESGGAVVLEAMAMAKPVIATAWGGPVDYVDTSCGFLIEPASRAALVKGFAASMAALRDSPELALQLGEQGRAKVVAHFDWDKKVDALMNIYATALGD